VTYPIDSAPANLPAALAWEAAFLELAKGELSEMATAANLSLAFQAERYASLSMYLCRACMCVCCVGCFLQLCHREAKRNGSSKLEPGFPGREVGCADVYLCVCACVYESCVPDCLVSAVWSCCLHMIPVFAGPVMPVPGIRHTGCMTCYMISVCAARS
jgi:hypothetical protein